MRRIPTDGQILDAIARLNEDYMKEKWYDHIPYMQVLDITIAYESAFGKAVRGHTDHNPYEENTPSWVAYNLGTNAGNQARKEMELKAS